MNARIVNLKKGLAIAGFLLLSSAASAQVMWNLKGGMMQRSFYENITWNEPEKRIDWMAGLELEIPLSSRLNLETGLRYKNHPSLVYPDGEYEVDWKFIDEREAEHHFELPLRLTYKQPLGEYFSLHVGVGPYASYAMGSDFGDEKWNKNIQVGLEPSIAINWACLSLGATYNLPCLYKGFKDENKPVVMATLGIRFKSSAWRYVGATLLTIVTVGGAAANAWSSAVEANQSYSSGSYGNSSSYSGGSSSGTGKSCTYCAGTGECRSLTDKYHCRGTGECKKCYGKGYDTINGQPYTCGYCHGSQKCHFCGGSGKCKHCNGTGKR